MLKPFPSSSTISMGSLSLFRDWLIRGHPPEEPSITTGYVCYLFKNLRHHHS
ncbi:hypothetical protein Hanom_Chr01g00037201 [Helianthus anomalus]